MRTALRSWIRRQLGLDDQASLIAGQRQDFDRLAEVLTLKDEVTAAIRRDVDLINRAAGTAITNLDARLHHYERTVPAIAGAKKALDARRAREAKKQAAADAAAQPQPSAQADGEGAESEAELAPPERRLELLREAEGEREPDSA